MEKDTSFVSLEELLAPVENMRSHYNVTMLIRMSSQPEDEVLKPHLGTPEKIADKAEMTHVSFSTPARVCCVEKTSICERECYAAKNRHLFGQVQEAYIRNARWLHSYRVHGDVEGAAQGLAALIYTPIFRFWESGDALDQFEVNVVTRTCELRPHTYFAVYTRRFRLDWRGYLSLPNTVLWASTDAENRRRAQKFVHRMRALGFRINHAYGPWREEDRERYLIGTGKPIPAESFICPAGDRIPLKGACTRCMLCYAPGRTPRSVVFPKH